MDSVSPVLTPAEIPYENVVALDQPEYYPVISMRITHQGPDGMVSPVTYTRFRFSEVERARIAAGADLLLGQPHHGPLMPVSLQLAMPSEYPAD